MTVLPIFAHITCVVLGVALACCLAGVAIGRLFHWRWILQQGPGLSAAVGMSGSLLFLEIWNLFLPLNHATVGVSLGLLLGSAIIFRRTFAGVVYNWFLNRSTLVTVLVLLLLVTVSLFGLGPMEYLHHDTGLYYLNAVRWARAYPAVPGLANLHGRLGFNQSIFLFVAFLSNLTNLGMARACQVTNPIFVFISGWAILDHLRLNLAVTKAKRGRLYAILLTCPLVFFATHIFISTPTGDIAAAVLTLPCALAFFSCVEEVFEKNPAAARSWLFVLIACGCSVVKLKLSYVFLAGGAVGIPALMLMFLQPRSFYRSWIPIGAFAAVLMVPWAMRGVILSGYPFYPSTFIRFRTGWAVPRQYADLDSKWIYGWARQPGKDPESVLENDDWFFPWIQRNTKEPENIFVFVFMATGSVLVLLSLLIPISREQRLETVLLIFYTLLALVFWFKTAPDPRFGWATLLLFGVNGCYAFTSVLGIWSDVRSSLFACLITVISTGVMLANEWPLLNDYTMKFPQGFPKAELQYRVTDSGLRVGIPKDQKAWDSGLVVTPEFDRYLTLRGQSLRDGFRTKFDKTDQDITTGN